MRKYAHIINPVAVCNKSDLFIAQPITFESMENARRFSETCIEVDLLSAQYPEDKKMVPEYFHLTPDLQSSVLDKGSFKTRRKLPLIKEILDRMYDASPDAEYLIYTNVDIALMLIGGIYGVALPDKKADINKLSKF